LPIAKAKAVKKERKKVIASGTFITKLEKMHFQIQALRALNLAGDKKIERLKNEADFKVLLSETRLQPYKTLTAELNDSIETPGFSWGNFYRERGNVRYSESGSGKP